MNEPCADILIHTIHNPIGRLEQITYEWKGKSPYVECTYNALDDLHYAIDAPRIQVGPYKLVLCEMRAWRMTNLYARADRLGSVRAWLYRASRIFDLAYRRAIITLAVWHLAEYRDYVIPSWRDIKLFKRP